MADGAELLLYLGLPAAIIGGVVLPLLGVVPDSAMIIASGSAGDKAMHGQPVDFCGDRVSEGGVPLSIELDQYIYMYSRGNRTPGSRDATGCDSP